MSVGFDLDSTLKSVEEAVADDNLMASAAEHIRIWLTDDAYAEYAAETAEYVAAERWTELNDLFWTIIPFGTGGRRGRMAPIGCNAINARTIGESVQGLVKLHRQDPARRRRAGPQQLPTTRVTAVATLPNCRPKSSSRAGFKSGFSTAIAARPELSFRRAT